MASLWHSDGLSRTSPTTGARFPEPTTWLPIASLYYRECVFLLSFLSRLLCAVQEKVVRSCLSSFWDALFCWESFLFTSKYLGYDIAVFKVQSNCNWRTDALRIPKSKKWITECPSSIEQSWLGRVRRDGKIATGERNTSLETVPKRYPIHSFLLAARQAANELCST